MRVTMDFETRSAIDIKKRGAWVYSRSPSTEPLCLGFTLDEDDEPQIWVPEWVLDIVSHILDPNITHVGCECPKPLADAILSGAEIEAHNAFFERAIWNHYMVPKLGWPEIQREQWRCSAAKASVCSLPRALGRATKVMGVEQKDDSGKGLINKVCVPRKALKNERKELENRGWKERLDRGWDVPGFSEPCYLWREDPQDYADLIYYCLQDVRAERSLSQSLPDLIPDELKVWQCDQDINIRGVYVDARMAVAAIKISDEAVARATQTARQISGDAFQTLRQVEQIKKWLKAEGVHLPNLQVATVDEALAGELPSDVRTVLTCMRSCAKFSVAKYTKMLLTIDRSDQRIRDFLMYHGASTGRWAGKLVQTHNLPRGKMKDPDTMCGIIRDGDIDSVDIFYGPESPMNILSWAIRGTFCAPPGRELVCADYSSVEARGTLWLVDDQDGLALFKRPKGEPGIYREMGGSIYNVPPASISKEGDDRRQIGKQAILGLGYGMGASKFMITCAGYGVDIDMDFAKHVVKTYRERFPLVPKGWRDIEKAAVKAVKHPGRIFGTTKVKFKQQGRFLMCCLPSGRKLYYCDPTLTQAKTPWGADTLKLSYHTMETQTGKWVSTETYGGKLVENIVQALCRDLMAYAIVNVELGDNPYSIVMHTHDEIVAEVLEGEGSVKEFVRMICVLPPWAYGFPLVAEGWRGRRYRK
jgi:DNA polymerase